MRFRFYLFIGLVLTAKKRTKVGRFLKKKAKLLGACAGNYENLNGSVYVVPYPPRKKMPKEEKPKQVKKPKQQEPDPTDVDDPSNESEESEVEISSEETLVSVTKTLGTVKAKTSSMNVKSVVILSVLTALSVGLLVAGIVLHVKSHTA